MNITYRLNNNILYIALDGRVDAANAQAVIQEANDDYESGIVIEVLQKGYELKGKVIRPAMVKVSE